MPTHYAPKGLIGLLTPQANTTAEPEAQRLLPPGTGMITARLVSTAQAMNDRLVAYIENIDTTTAQFANAPIDALAFACTGSSYLIGREREAALIANSRVPLHTAGTAVVAALATLNARRIALVSPYAPDLTQASAAYWQSHGLTVTQVARIAPDTKGHHPIYALAPEAAAAALAGVRGDHDAVLLLGTGLPSLGLIAAHRGKPLISCMTALIWHAARGLGAIPDGPEPLLRLPSQN